MSDADKIEAARALIEPLRATVLWQNANPNVMKAADLLAALTDLADAQAQENAKLRGLLWHASHEFNAIRARDGAPRASCSGCLGPALVSEEWWNTLTEAFGEAIGKEARTPWPSPEAKAVSAALRASKPEDDTAAQEEIVCTCGAGHGSLEGHTDWCDYAALGDAP